MGVVWLRRERALHWAAFKVGISLCLQQRRGCTQKVPCHVLLLKLGIERTDWLTQATPGNPVATPPPAHLAAAGPIPSGLMGMGAKPSSGGSLSSCCTIVRRSTMLPANTRGEGRALVGRFSHAVSCARTSGQKSWVDVVYINHTRLLHYCLAAHLFAFTSTGKEGGPELLLIPLELLLIPLELLLIPHSGHLASSCGTASNFSHKVAYTVTHKRLTVRARPIYTQPGSKSPNGLRAAHRAHPPAG